MQDAEAAIGLDVCEFWGMCGKGGMLSVLTLTSLLGDSPKALSTDWPSLSRNVE